MVHIGKAIVISFKDGEEEVLERVLSVLTNEVQIEPMQVSACSVLQYPGPEIRLAQRKVLRNGEEVWHMDSNSCYTAVSNTISRLRAKIETDRKNPVYTKTVQDVYMFDMQRNG